MNLKNLLTSSILTATLFFSWHAYAAGSGSQCKAAKAELNRVIKIRDSLPLHSPEWVQAAFAVLDAQYYVDLTCVASSIGFE